MNTNTAKGFSIVKVHRSDLFTWIVVLAAASVRLIYLWMYNDSVFFHVPMWDAEEYHSIATALSKGTVPQQLTFRPPLYPVLLSIVYMIFGSGVLMPRLIQIVIGILSCVLVKKIAERFYGEVAGLIAGLIVSAAGLIVYFDLELLPTNLAVFLFLLFINELTDFNSRSNSSWRIGFIWSLAALTRPTLALLFPLGLWWIWHRSRNVKSASLYILTGLTPLLLSLILHLIAGTGPVAISAQGGVNFYIGNHRSADGITANFPGIGAGWSWDHISDWSEAKTGRQMNAAEMDRMLWKEGLSEITTSPGIWMKKTFRKALLFWNRIEISSNRDLYYHGHRFPFIGFLMMLSFPLLLPFAFAGLAFSWKDENVRLTIAIMIIYFLTVTLFFVNARFRHPLTPLLAILAAGGIVQTWRLIRQKEYGKYLLVPLSAFVAGVLLPFMSESGVDRERWDYGLFSEGMVYERTGNRDKAVVFYKQALKHNPRAPYINFKLGEIAYDQGDLRIAADYYQAELENQPYNLKALNNLGIALSELGAEDKALQAFERTLQINPRFREASGNAARILARQAIDSANMDDWEASRGLVNRALEYEPSNLLYRTLLLECRVNLRDTVGVVSTLSEILRINPGFAPALELKSSLDKK